MVNKNKTMKSPILIIFMCCILNAGLLFSQKTVVYTKSSTIIANPERGLQKYTITDANYNTNTNYTNLDLNTLTTWRTGTDKVTVIYRYFYLNNFLNSDISQIYLNNMQKDFDVIRNSGIKCIIRFSYSDAQSTQPQQPTKAQILSHLSQLAPIMNTNKDVILSHQAGLIGTWGEWYYTNSTEFGTDGTISPAQWQNRKDVVDAMLTATSIEIPLQVRYAGIKKTLYGSVALTPSTAYKNTPNARIGFFNDAFLNDWGDQGMYSVSSQYQNPISTADYKYIANETKYTPMTGETDGVNAPRTDGPNAVYEMDSTNWTTLNRDYFATNWTNWINTGYYNEILSRLGYRFVLDSTEFILNGNQLSVNIILQNEGFAQLFKQRNLWLILKNITTEYPFLITIDPRTWKGNIVINQNIDISALPSGIYDSYLSLPDPDANLAKRAEYSIQFANNAIWNGTLGYNNLLQQINKVTTQIVQNEEINNNVISVYPNPAKTNVVVSSNSLMNQVLLINIIGQVVLELTPNSNSVNIDLSKFNSGVYFLRVTNANTQQTRKIIVE